MTDYTTMDGPELLAACRDDAAKWAAAFCQHAKKLGHNDIDEGWMIGWFANAIEHSCDVRTGGGPLALSARVERLKEALQQFADCDLNERNCASLEVATRRIQNIARAALTPKAQP